MIESQKVDEVRNAADIVEVVGEHVKLKRQGGRFVGLCPFHKEKSPSFSVEPANKLFYCFGCLEEHEPIWTGRGLVPIGEVGPGDTVLGIDGEPEIVTHRVVKRQPVLALALDAVRRDPLLLTADHTCTVVRAREAERVVPMLYRQSDRGVRFQSRRRTYATARAARIEEVPAGSVRPGDFFLFPVVPGARRADVPLASPAESVPVQTRAVAGGTLAVRVRKGPVTRTFAALPVNARAARLYGLWLAEGSCYRGGVRWSFHAEETDYARSVVEALAGEFGLRARMHARPERTLLEVTCSNTHLAALFAHHFGRGAAGKRLPAAALSWTAETQRALLTGYLDGDGCGAKEGEGRAVSVSPDLARGIFALAIQARRPVTLSRDALPTTAGRTVWAVNVRSRESLRGFFHPIGDVDYYWMPVARVTPLEGERNVVDLTVTGTHTFTTRLGAVHNCHKGGDVFTFVREVEGVGFLDAVRGLAEKYHVPLPEEGAPDQERASLQESVHGALRFAGRFFYGQLTKTDEGRGALDYLTRRGLTPETIKQYGLGYAPERWDALALAAAAEGLSEDVLEAAGLVIRRKEARAGQSERSGGVYDRYRGRVIFPIFSHTGRVVGFGGRIMTDAKDQPKYINSPETVVYSKSRVLYGLYAGRQEIRRTEEAVFVEGYTDVLAMHQAGLTNAVATCGTALTPDQVALVGRFAKRIVLLYDGDSAGLTAAVKGAETVVANWTLDPDEEKSTRAAGLGEVLRKGLIVYVVALPPGEDPDSYARQHGAEALREYVQKRRQDFVAFAFEAAARAGRLATPEGKAEVQEEIVGTIARLPSPLLQENYLARAAEVLKIPLPRLHETLERHARSPRAREDAADARQAERDDRPEAPRRVAPVMVPAESVLLRVMLQEGDPMVEHVLGRMGLDEFSDGAVRAVVEALIVQYEAGAVEPSALLGGGYGPDVQHLAALVLSQQSYLSEGWREQNVQMTEDAYGAAESAMMLLKLRRVDDAIATQRAACRAAEADGTLEAAQRRLMQLQDVRKSIERRDFLNDAEAA